PFGDRNGSGEARKGNDRGGPTRRSRQPDGSRRAHRMVAADAVSTDSRAGIVRRSGAARRSSGRVGAAGDQVFGKLHVPVGNVEKGLPLLVARSDPTGAENGVTGRPLRRADQLHPRRVQHAVPLATVARNARAHDVVPGREPAPRKRNDVIEVELRLREDSSAVLATITIAKKDVPPGEPHLASRHTVVVEKLDHAGNANLPPWRDDPLVPD